MIEILGAQYFGERLGAGFAALMMVPFHHRVTHWAEHRFEAEAVERQRGIGGFAMWLGPRETRLPGSTPRAA